MPKGKGDHVMAEPVLLAVEALAKNFGGVRALEKPRPDDRRRANSSS